MTLSGFTTRGPNGPRSDGNEGVSAFSKALPYLSLTLRLLSVISKILVEEILTLCRESVSVIYSSRRLGYIRYRIDL